jgi:hypothetical protein
MSEIKGVLPQADPHYDPKRLVRENIVAAPTYDGDLEHTGGKPESAAAAAPATA